jgi:hypothetical protein
VGHGLAAPPQGAGGTATASRPRGCCPRPWSPSRSRCGTCRSSWEAHWPATGEEPGAAQRRPPLWSQVRVGDGCYDQSSRLIGRKLEWHWHLSLEAGDVGVRGLYRQEEARREREGFYSPTLLLHCCMILTPALMADATYQHMRGTCMQNCWRHHTCIQKSLASSHAPNGVTCIPDRLWHLHDIMYIFSHVLYHKLRAYLEGFINRLRLLYEPSQTI